MKRIARLFLYATVIHAFTAESAFCVDAAKAIASAFSVQAKLCLVKVYTAEQYYRANNGEFTNKLDLLDVADKCVRNVTLKADKESFFATLSSKGIRMSVNEKKEFFHGDSKVPEE